MRVLHLLHRSVPGASGYAIRSREIVVHQLSKGLEPMVVTSPSQAPLGDLDSEHSEYIDGVRYFRTGGRILPPTRDVDDKSPVKSSLRVLQNVSLLKTALRTARAYRPQVIHGHSPFTCGMTANMVGRWEGIPTIYEVRGIWEESHTSRYGISERSFRYRAVRSLEDRALKGADLCCVICEALKEEIVSRGINPEKIVVVPNGVDAATFVPGPAKEELQRRLDLLGCFVIGYIGSFSAYEGLDIAVKGVIRLAEDFPNLRLLLVGDGELRPELERIASEGGIADRVIFTGRIAYSEITDFYRLCDVMVLPRRDARVTRLVTPLKPLEVMAMAKPLLASDIGGHREIVENGVNGMLFKSENVEDLTAQWRLLINNRELRLDLGSKARNWVEKHRNWSVLIERYTDIYDELAGKASR